MSDLHLEFEPPKLVTPEWKRLVAERKALPGHPEAGPLLKDVAGVQLMVLAGDVATGLEGIAYADSVSAYLGCPVVYVAGNHEYYGHDFDELRTALKEAAWATDGRVIFLDRDWVRLWLGDSQLLVFGCTLWSDYALLGDQDGAMARSASIMTDHRSISRKDRWFSPQDALDEHRRSLSWLAELLPRLKAQEARASVLVVTHHAPCREGLGERPEAQKPAYASDLEARIRQWSPDWWLHGHTHHRHESMVGTTLVASAPRGYLKPGGMVEAFQHAEIRSAANSGNG